MSAASTVSIDHSKFQGNTVISQAAAGGGAISSQSLISSNKVIATGAGFTGR